MGQFEDIKKTQDLVGKISISEVLLELSKVYEVAIREKKKLSEIQKECRSWQICWSWIYALKN